MKQQLAGSRFLLSATVAVMFTGVIAGGCASASAAERPKSPIVAAKPILLPEAAPERPATQLPGAISHPMGASAPRAGADELRWVSMAYPTGSRATSAILLEKGVPSSAQTGQSFEYVLRVTNISNMELSTVLVEDEVSGSYELESTSPERLPADGGKLRWAFSKLAPGESKTIRVRGRASGTSDLSGCASVAFSSGVCTRIPVSQPDLKLVKTMTGEALICDPIQVAYTVSNPGTGVARSVIIEDDLPEGLLVAADGRRKVAIPVGDLAGGESKTYRIALRASRAGEFTNTAIARSASLKSESSAKTLVREPSLKITQQTPEQSYLGKTVCSDVMVNNEGNGEAKDAVAYALLPGGAEFLSASDGGKLVDGKIHWHLGNLPPGGARKVTVCYKPARPGIYKPVFSANAFCSKAVSVDGKTSTVGIAAILLEVIDVNDPVAIGGEEIYTITATNQGSSDGSNIAIVASLEDAAQFVAGTGATSVQSREGAAIRFAPLARLAPGAKATWQVRVKAIKEGDIRFKVSMTEDRLGRPVEETEATTFYQK